MPIESATEPPHDAHCRIHVGDGTLGSGTLISTNDTTGLVLTCSHLFDDTSSDVVVSFPHGGRFGARLIDRDPANDLAALLIQRPNVEPLAVDDREPTGVLTACGYGGNGQFRPATGAVAGAVQTVGATFPSLKIQSAVRPGDSGGGVLNRAGQLVGVVWGCRDGETYLTCGRPLRQFLNRVWQGRGERASARGDSAHPPSIGKPGAKKSTPASPPSTPKARPRPVPPTRRPQPLRPEVRRRRTANRCLRPRRKANRRACQRRKPRPARRHVLRKTRGRRARPKRPAGTRRDRCRRLGRTTSETTNCRPRPGGARPQTF